MFLDEVRNDIFWHVTTSLLLEIAQVKWQMTIDINKVIYL